MTAKFWNLIASTGQDGAKTLNVQVQGVIDGGWLDDGTSTAEIIAALAEHPDAKKIDVHINSVGGSLWGGIALYNVLEAHPAEVTSYVDGLAASAASIVAMAGKTVMGRGAMMMIHNPMAAVMGDARELRRTAADLDKAQASLLAVYKAKTGKDGAELRAMLDAETFLTAEQAVRQGFANEIADGAVEVKAEGEQVFFNSVAFPRTGMPAQFLAMATASPPVDPAEPEAPAEPAEPAVPPPAEPAPAAAATNAADVAKAIAAARAEGHAAGIAEERARIKAIDELPVRGHADLVFAAKYGDAPMTSDQLGAAVVRAEAQAGANHLAQRTQSTKAAAGVAPDAPEHTSNEAALAHAVRLIVGDQSDRRGGSR